MWLYGRIFCEKLRPSRVHIVERFYTRYAILRNKPSLKELGFRKNKVNKERTDVDKIIEGTILKEIPSKVQPQNRMVQNMRKLAAKNFVLAKVFNYPIAVIDWTELPKNDKVDSAIRFFSRWFIFVSTFTIVTVIILCCHIEEHKITGRTFIDFNPTELSAKYDEVLLTNITNKNEKKFLPSSNALIQQTDKIVTKLIESNKEFVDDHNFDLNWSVSVIDDTKNLNVTTADSMKFIIVTKSMVELCQNEHQLAYVLAKALAHFLLQHNREPLSNIEPYNIWTGLKLIYLSRLWYLFQSANNFENQKLKALDNIDHSIGNYLFKFYRNVVENLNFSDILEEEADRIALQMLSRSCYDIREVEKFAANCLQLAQNNETDSEHHLRYIYKHRFNIENKLNFMKENMNKFIDFRQKCGCDILK